MCSRFAAVPIISAHIASLSRVAVIAMHGILESILTKLLRPDNDAAEGSTQDSETPVRQDGPFLDVGAT